MPDLEHCPFCGGKVFFDTLNVITGREHCIMCSDCHCIFTTLWNSPSKYDLADAWNRRTTDESNNRNP